MKLNTNTYTNLTGNVHVGQAASKVDRGWQKIVSTVIAIVLSIASLGLVACASQQAKITSSVVFVVQNTANSAAINTEPLKEFVREVCQTNGYLDIIYVSGAPTSIDGGGTIVGSTSKTAARREDENEEWVANIISMILEGKPTSEEVDMLNAIDMASRSLAQAPEGEKAIVVVGSCISTAGYLSFVPDGAISADPQEYVDYLSGLDALPTGMSGVPVHFFYIGEVSGQQDDLTPQQTNNLKAIYQNVLGASGAECHFEQAIPGTTEPAEGLPKVTLIDFPEDPAQEFNPPTPQQPTVVEFNNDDVRFVGDQASFVDKNATSAILDPFAQGMLDDPGMTLHITGCTASGGADKSFVLWLSQARADVVKEYFVSKGVAPERITTYGAGDSLAEPDCNADGSYIPAAAANNRKIIMEFATTS